jgi:hypothetical protein
MGAGNGVGHEPTSRFFRKTGHSSLLSLLFELLDSLSEALDFGLERLSLPLQMSRFGCCVLRRRLVF